MKSIDEYLPRNASVPDVARWASKAQPEDARTVVKALTSTVRTRRTSLREEADRVRFARVVVGLIPATLGLIKELLNHRRTELDYEIHFTLFCYLDDVLSIKALSGFSPVLLRSVVDYLRAADSGKARAAWMATDLLSDHWSGDEGAGALLEVYGGDGVKNGTKELVREALERCLKRRDVSTAVKRRVRETLLPNSRSTS